jgi:anaerobic selenocysteine-containing dehydrogenase
MCHESSGLALTQTIGVGKGSVTLDDIHAARLLVVVGQNPGTNHPRMLSALERAKRNGAVIVAVNPLPEAGLIRFKNPQKARGLVGAGTPLADHFLQIRVGGDLALFQAIGSLLVEWGAVDREFVDAYTRDFADYARAAETRSPGRASSRLRRDEIEATARLFASSRPPSCWAMGLTQCRTGRRDPRDRQRAAVTRHAGRPGADMPVRGHPMCRVIAHGYR